MNLLYSVQYYLNKHNGKCPSVKYNQHYLQLDKP